MMAPGLFMAAAVLAVASPTAALAAATPTSPAVDGAKQNDLYSPSPSRPGSGVAAGFYRSYGRKMGEIELTDGARLGPMMNAPRAATAADERAGIGSTGNVLRIAALTFLVLLLGLAAVLTVPSAARAAGVPDEFTGITTEDAYTGNAGYARTAFARQHNAGFTIARQVFRWNEIEPRDGQYDFSATDRFVLNAAKSKMRVMPLLMGEPEWASSRPKPDTSRALYPPKNPAVYGRFAAAVAARYGPGGTLWTQHPNIPAVPILSYQLWNEPNFPVYWAMKPDAAAYARLVKAGSAGLRSVQPGAYVVSAGIPDSAIGQSPRTFVRRMLAAGAGPSLNAIGIHPYAISVSSVVKITRSMRKVINAAGGKNLQMWITEIGWGAGGPATKKRTVSFKRQGPVIRSAFQTLARLRTSLGIHGIVYFAWRDSEVYPGGHDFWGLHTGLIDRAGKDKPALKIVARTLRKLR